MKAAPQLLWRRFHSVGEQGIEPCLHEPESYVLPAYSSPQTDHINNSRLQ